MAPRKEIYLIRGTRNETYSEFEEALLNRAQSLLEDEGLVSLKVSLTRTPPPRLSLIPFKQNKVAVMSICWKDGSGSASELFNEIPLNGRYEVEEAVPVAYKKNWSDGSQTPGICLLTLFRKKPGISWSEFLDRWHNGHTPLSLKIHPLWNYNRNVVVKTLKEGGEHWDGIVEEQFATRSDLLNPIKFFGNPLIMPYRMWQVYADVNSFLEYKSVEPYFAQEIILKSSAPDA